MGDKNVVENSDTVNPDSLLVLKFLFFNFCFQWP